MPGKRNWRDTFSSGSTSFSTRVAEEGGAGYTYRQYANLASSGTISLANGWVENSGSSPGEFFLARARSKNQGGILRTSAPAGGNGSSFVITGIHLRANRSNDLGGFTSRTQYEIEYLTDGTINLIKWVNSSQTILSSEQGVLAQLNNPYKLEANIEGNRIRAYMNDTLFVDYTDNSSPINNVGYVGFSTGAAEPTRLIRLTELEAYDLESQVPPVMM